MVELSGGDQQQTGDNLTDEEIARLSVLREKVQSGEVDDLTIEYKRFSFLKYLCEVGKVSS